MKNIIGSPVYGDNFLFRDKVLRMGLKLLENGNSFLMLGIRRTGKSSYLRQVAHQIKSRDTKNVCIEIDCSTYQSVFDFYRGLYDALPKGLRIRFRKALEDSRQIPKKIIDYITDFIEGVEAFGGAVTFRDKMMVYNKTFENVVTTFFKSDQNENVFLFIDELPFFFENITIEDEKAHEVQMLLTSLRNWRNAGVPMGITGSLNLHQQLEFLGLSRKLLAGLNTITLKPFNRTESAQLFKELLDGKDCDWWTDGITNKLLDLMPDYVPYFLQYAFNAVMVNECNEATKIEEIYHNDIFPGLFADFIYQFEDRLKSYKGEDLNAAMKLLDEVAKRGKVTLDELQEALGEEFDYAVLIRLIDYEFLTISGDQEYSFTLNIIHNWWKQKRNL